MKYIQHRVIALFIGLIWLSTCATGVLAQGTNSPYSVRVEIRYRKQLGYQAMSPQGPTSCSVFELHFKVDDGSDRGQLERVIKDEDRNDEDRKMADMGRYYACSFFIPDLRQDNKVTVTPKIPLNSMATQAWLGGPQAQPPDGARRVIADETKSITVTQSAPRPTLVFVMLYSEPPVREAPVQNRKIDIFKKP